MAIQMRRGLLANLDKSRLVAGEIVVATDSGTDYVGVAKAPNNVIDLATRNDLANVVIENGGVAVKNEVLVFTGTSTSYANETLTFMSGVL